MPGAKSESTQPLKRFEELARKLAAVSKREMDQQRVLVKRKQTKQHT